MRDWIQWLRSEHPEVHAELVAGGDDLQETALALEAAASQGYSSGVGSGVRSVVAVERARCAAIVRMGVVAGLCEMARELVADGTDVETAYLRFLGAAQGQDAVSLLVAIRRSAELEQLATH